LPDRMYTPAEKKRTGNNRSSGAFLGRGLSLSSRALTVPDYRFSSGTRQGDGFGKHFDLMSLHAAEQNYIAVSRASQSTSITCITPKGLNV